MVFRLPGMLLVYAANGIFRGLAKVTITLVAAIAGAVVNTILDDAHPLMRLGRIGPVSAR